MKIHLLIPLMIVALLVSACSIPASAAQSAPTQTPTPARTRVSPTRTPAASGTAQAKAQSATPTLALAPARDQHAGAMSGVPKAVSAEVIPCPIALPADETDGATIICGRMLVPENWGEPNRRSIPITYLIMRTPNRAPFLDPILFFEGGPGGSAIEKAPEYLDHFARLRATRDVVIWDQRGTAYSSPLDCPLEVQVTDVAAFDAQHAGYRDRIATYNADTDPDRVYQDIAEYAATNDFGRCLPLFEEQGIDISQYGTANTVLDSLALMRHLGYPEYNLYGISYGTLVVLSIAEYYEKHPELDLPPVRSAVIDGIFPRNVEWYEQAFMQPYNILRVFSDCEADAACGAAYPHIRQRAVDLLGALDEAPLARKDGSEIAASDLVRVMYAAVSSKLTLIPYLPRIVAELERGVTDGFDYAEAAPAAFSLPTGAATGSDESMSNAGIDALASQLQSIQMQMKDYAVGNEIVARAALKADSRPTLYVGLLNEYIRRVPATGEIIKSLLEPYVLHPDQRTRDDLLLIASAATYRSLREEMTALANLFTEEEVNQVYDLLLRPEYLNGLVGFDWLTTHVVDCNDRAYSFFNDVAFEGYRAFEAPQLVTSKVYLLAEWQVRCEQLGLAAEAYAPPPPGIAADWRMLVVNGSLDPNTPVEWGEYALESLTDAHMITVPLAKHGASILSDCAKDITNAFFLSPDADLNLSCLEEMRPIFVLPDDELPASSE